MSAVQTILNRSTHSLQSLKSLSLQKTRSTLMLTRCTPFTFKELSVSYNNYMKQSIHTRSTSLVKGDSSIKTKILSQSSLLVQDGIGFEELPILIRRVTKDSFPFTSYSYTGTAVKEVSGFDISFREALQNCNSVTSVFKLLEIPHNQVEGYSAAFALQRLHELKSLNTDWHHIHSFIRSAVMRELYDTVQADVKLLSSDSLISLVECYLNAEGFSYTCIEAINEEIQVRLADSAFTISELLMLAEVLKENNVLRSKPRPETVEDTTKNSDYVSHTLSKISPSADVHREDLYQAPVPQHFDKFSAKASTEMSKEVYTKCHELLENVWVHLISRYHEIDEHTLPRMLQALSVDRRSVVPLLERPVSNIWTELTPEGVETSLLSLCRLRVHNAALMTSLGRWAYVHIHQITPGLLLNFLHTFNQFCFLDDNLIKVAEKYLQVKGTKVDLDVLSMCVEYCTRSHFLSPIILDCAANHLTEHGDSYNPLQLYAVVRAFGYLNYLPTRSSAFLKKAETCLVDQFPNMKEHQILEILGSLTFVNVLPKNFYSRVTTTDFFTKVGALRNPEKASALMWLRVLKNAVSLSVSTDINSNFNWLLAQKTSRSVFLYLDSHRIAIMTMRDALDTLVGPTCNHVLPFYGCCAIYLDKNRRPLQIQKTKTEGTKVLGDIDKKLVMMLRSVDHFTVNTRQLVGAQAQRTYHLAKLGFTVVEVRASHLFFQPESVDIVEEHLAPHVDLEGVKEARQKGDGGMATPTTSDTHRDWLNFANSSDIFSDDDGSGDD